MQFRVVATAAADSKSGAQKQYAMRRGKTKEVLKPIQRFSKTKRTRRI